MKIDDKDDKPNTGRIHVDYAQARDDLYEWECKQRALAREMRHRSRLEEERLRPPSPPPIIHYSDHEASLLMEKLKGTTIQKTKRICRTMTINSKGTTYELALHNVAQPLLRRR